MATDGGAAAASPPDPDLERPAFLELFFDLVYVFALVTLATVLADDLTWTGVAETLVLLLAFTMIWALTVVGGGQPSTWPARRAGAVHLGGGGQPAVGRGSRPTRTAITRLLFAITYVVIHLGTAATTSWSSRSRRPPLPQHPDPDLGGHRRRRLDRWGARRWFGPAGDLGARRRRRVRRGRRSAGRCPGLGRSRAARVAAGRRAGGRAVPAVRHRRARCLDLRDRNDLQHERVHDGRGPGRCWWCSPPWC